MARTSAWAASLKQVVVMPCVASERLSVALEQLDLAVDGEHLFDEGSPEVEQAHRKGFLVLRAH
jgi:hypothetical protein